MSALLKNKFFESEANSAQSLPSRNAWEPTLYTIVRRPRAENAESVAPAGLLGTVRNIALFLASPIIGLAYIVAMPFVAASMLAFFAGKAVFSKFPMVKHAAMMLAAPVIGLAFILVAPIVGLGALGYMGSKALAKN